MADVFTELSVKYDFNEKRWDTWLRANLVSAAQRIAGSNSYGISMPDLERLERLVVIDSELRGRRTPKKIAYYAALSGIPAIPADLVGEFVVDSIYFMYGQLRRYISRLCDGKYELMGLPAERVSALAQELAVRTVVGLPIDASYRNQTTTTLKDVFVVWISIAYAKSRPQFLDNRIKSISRAFFTSDTWQNGFSLVRKILCRDSASFTDPSFGVNSLIEDTRRAIDEPDVITVALADTRALLSGVYRRFGPPDPSSTLPEQPDQRETEMIRNFLYWFPNITAVMIQAELHYPQSAALSMLRETKGQNISDFIAALERIANVGARRYGFGQR
jgi:hypothetical protein